MKPGSISEKVVKQFGKSKVITKNKMTELSNGDTHSHAGVIQSLKRRGYDIKITRADDEFTILKYTLISYTKPFYLVARDIERNHPKLEKYIRLIYNLIKNTDDGKGS